jgi:hypothetical protein
MGPRPVEEEMWVELMLAEEILTADLKFRQLDELDVGGHRFGKGASKHVLGMTADRSRRR